MSWSVKEYSELKKINIATVYRWVSAGKLDIERDGTKLIINGTKKDIGCRWVVKLPDDPRARYWDSGCGHSMYAITKEMYTFKICPWCGLKLMYEKERRN